MDPFSLTVGILTMLKAGGTIGTGLKKVVALRKAPDILLALNNEVVDLQIVVQDVDDLLRQHEQNALAPIRSLCQALEESKETMSRLESLIAYELTTTKGKELRLDCSAWLRKEHEVLELRDHIRTDRLRLVSALGILAASNSSKADRDIGQLRMTMERLDLHVYRTGKELSSQLLDLKGSVQDFYEGKHQCDAHLGNQTSIEAASSSALGCKDPLLGFELSTQRSIAQDGNTLLSPQAKYSEPAPATSLSFIRNACSIGCSCACHKRSRLQSPPFLNAVLGSMMVGYSALPSFKQTCDDASCRGHSAKITYTYVFPQWFVSRVIHLKMVNDAPRGPELCLRVVRVRPAEADIFFAAEAGDETTGLHRIKCLLSNGEASVLDVNPRGETALMRAVKFGKAAIIELLMKAGSDPLFEDFDGYSPYMIAWRAILTAQVSREHRSFNALRHIFSDQTHLTVFEFPILLGAYFDLSGKIFGSILSLTPRSAIDQVDVSRRTTLSWAAQKGDSETLIQLLGCGADPHRADNSGMRPLHWSVYAATTETMRLLLAAKAEIDAKNHYGKTALAFAVDLCEDISFTKILLSHGADIESRDNSGHGLLHWAAHGNRSAQVSVLLENGADINAVSSMGMSAIAYAIMFNSHNALSVLLNSGELDYKCKDSDGRLLTHLAAHFGDMKTLDLFKAARLSKIDLAAKSAHGYTALDMAKWRRHNNEQWAYWALKEQDEDPLAWLTAFEAFIESIADAQRAESEESAGVEQTTEGASSRGTAPEAKNLDEDDDEQEDWYDATEAAD